MDSKTLAQMESLGLPTGFSLSHGTPARDARLKTKKKGSKMTWKCHTCLIELSSEDTMIQHLTGVKHMKKQIQRNQEIEEKRRYSKYLKMSLKSSNPLVQYSGEERWMMITILQ